MSQWYVEEQHFTDMEMIKYYQKHAAEIVSLQKLKTM